MFVQCFGHRSGKNVGPRDAAWGPVGPSVGQWTCVSRPEATGRLYHKDNEMNEDELASGQKVPEIKTGH
jgi:hypothetical protein